MALRDAGAVLLAAIIAASPAMAGDSGRNALDRLILKRNYTAAAELAGQRAAAGDPEAQYRYGMMLRAGTGVTADPAKAQAWFTKAAAGGSRKAAALLRRIKAVPAVPRTSLPVPPWTAKAEPSGPAVDPGAVDPGRRSWIVRAAARGKTGFMTEARSDAAREEALIAAVGAGQIGSAAALLAPAVLNGARDGAGKTALMLAAASPELLQMLIAAEADPAARDAKGRDALSEAVRRCSGEGVGLLLRAGAQPSFDAAQMTPLHHAVLKCADATLVQRLAAVQDADAPDRHGRTALWYAAAGGKAELIPVLAAAGAAPGFPDSDGLTPLHAAARAGSATAVAALLKAGVPVAAQGKGGDTALMLASASGCENCVAALLEAGAAVDAANQRGDTALILAVKSGKTETVHILLQAGADADQRNMARETARLVAARIGDGAMQALIGTP